jgi:protein gp37
VSDKSEIEWTDATWNPVTGCSKVSEGCRNCYAEALSLRFGRSKKPWAAAFAAENVVLHPERLKQPFKWREPRTVFVNSMSDLFHEQIPDDYIGRIFRVMERTPQHTYQILTKRPERMRQWYLGTEHHRRGEPPLPNVWLGVSVEDQHAAHGRVPILLGTPAAVRFLSCEPLLAPVDLSLWLEESRSPEMDMIDSGRPRHGHLHWVIVGGESGPRRRPMDLNWARSLRDQCVSAGVPFFFKQVGGRTPKAGGRWLDGRTWDEMPDSQPSDALSEHPELAIRRKAELVAPA